MNRTILFEHFGKKWTLATETVTTIFYMVSSSERKYGKVSRALGGMGIDLSARQLKYFYKKIVLIERYGTREEIGKENFLKLVKSKV